MIQLDDLHAPPARPEFREELRRRIETGERLARRRRRAAALVAVVAAVGIASAASVSAFRQGTRPPADATYACTVPQVGGIYRVDAVARVRGPATNAGGVMIPNRAEATFSAASPMTPQGTSLVGLDEFPNGFGSSDQLCRATRANVPLTHAALPSVSRVSGTKGATISKECWLAPTVTIRAHVAYDDSGVPTSAQLVLRSGKRLRPAAFIDWTPTRVAVYTAPSCNRG
jgi:hypothetical protein